MKKVLISGGDGKFASEIKKYNTEYEIIAPSRNEMDVHNIEQVEHIVSTVKPDILLHAAAHTRPMVSHEKHPDISIKTNIIGTANIVLVCMKYNIKLVYISTDYVYPGTEGNYSEKSALLPVNKYAWSKLGGECAVMLYINSLILRMSMFEKPFPHPKAIIDIKKSLIYMDEAAKITLKLIEEFGVINVGGEPSTIYDFVKKLNPEVGKIELKDIKDVEMALDSSMNIDKLRKILMKKDISKNSKKFFEK